MTEKHIRALKRNGEYWKQRFDILDAAGTTYGLEAYKEVDEAFVQAQRDIQRDIDSWLSRLAKNNNVSLYEANKMLVGNELKEFKWDVKQYIKYGEENALNGKWMKQLESASARSHISRLEAIQVRTQQSIEKAFGVELDIVDRMARKTFTDGYYKSAFEIQKGLGVGWKIGEIDQRKLDKIVSKPWTADGKTFSDRIWNKKNQMLNELHQELTRNCIYGKSLEDTIKQMERYVDNSVKNAGYAAKRLIVTENAAFRTKSHYEGLKDVGAEKYKVMLTIDAKSCPVCVEMNGKVFSMSEFQLGVTAPPFHPNCDTGTLVPVIEDLDESLNGEEIDGIEFDEWKDRFVGESEDNSGFDGVDKSGNSGIIENSVKPSDFSAEDISQAESIAREKLGLETVDYSKFDIDAANAMNNEISRFYDIFGELREKGVIKSVMAVNIQNEKVYGVYLPQKGAIYINSFGGKVSFDKLFKDAKGQYNIGYWSTGNAEQLIRHELGHAVQHCYTDNNKEMLDKISALREQVMNECGVKEYKDNPNIMDIIKAGKQLSYYALESNAEFIAEAVAEYMGGNPRIISQNVVNILLGRD